MTCADMEEALPELLEGGEPGPDAAAHLAQCASCRRQLEEMRTLWDELEPAGSAAPFGTTGNADGSMRAGAAPAVALITRDLRATAEAWQKAPALWAAAGAIGVGLVAACQMRDNFSAMGLLMGPVSAAVLFLLAAVAMRMGLQLSGLKLQRGILLLAATAVVFLLYGSLSESMLEPAVKGAHHESGVLGWRPGLHCLESMFFFSLPVLAVAGWLLRAARLPTMVSSLVLGAGASLASAGVLHLVCPVSTLRHLLMYHGGGVVLVSMLTALAGVLIARRALRRVA